jgi:hypothetical protein
MGIRESESLPAVFAELANRHGGRAGPVEAWTLALPGWNTLAETAALWFFFQRLRPDGVVFCLSSNDEDSLGRALPGGALTMLGISPDEFGDPHPIVYPLRQLDSHRFRARWRTAMAAVAEAEQRLAALGIPVMVDFLARWRPPQAHALAYEAGLSSPYVITPVEYTHGRWLNPPPILHGTAEANRVLGAIAYQAWAEAEGWGRLPPTEAPPRLPLFRRPPEGARWTAAAAAAAGLVTRREVPESFRPGPAAARQSAGPLDSATGLLGRATTVLVRRRAGASRLAIEVRRLEKAAHLYPLALEVSIPSAAGGTRAVVEIPAGGPEPHRFTVPLPADVPAGAALDVVLVASRTTAAPGLFAPRSLYLLAIEQQP